MGLDISILIHVGGIWINVWINNVIDKYNWLYKGTKSKQNWILQRM